MNELIIQELQKLADKEKTHPFKYKAYCKAISTLSTFPSQIISADQVSDLPGIGKGIQEKIALILENGQLTITPDPRQEIFSALLNIYGVGEKKANELIDKHHVLSLADLKKNPALLNEKQRLGLKYYSQLLERIPHQEMVLHQKFIRNIWENDPHSEKLTYTFEIVGSFRRKCPTSGDIDILITFDPSQNILPRLVFTLRRNNYIIETLAEGPKKFMGICRLPRLTPRRIDIIWTPPDEYPFALFYFTGNDKYNRAVRDHAKRLGYRLNEKSLEPITPDAKKTPLPIFQTEKDITDFLQLPYLSPEQRN